MSASSGYGGGSSPVGPVIETLTGNVGGPVGPTGNNINIIGAGGVLVTGNPGTSTLTITVSGEATLFTEDTGTATPLAGNLNIFGGASTAGINMHTHGDGGNTVTVILNDSLLFPNTNGSGSQGVLFWGGNRFVHNFGTNNTYVGSNAGNLTGIGINNVGIGTNAITAETAASNLVAIGVDAMLNMSTGIDCIAIGKQSMTLGTALESSVAIGSQSLSQCLTGIFNIAIGEQAGTDYTGNESSNILINHFGIVGEDHVMRLGTDGVGDGEQNATYIAGVYNRTFASPSGVMQIDHNFKVGSSAGTDGQILIGATGASPVWANITAGANIAIVNAANSIEISASGGGGGGAVNFPADVGTAVEAGGILNIFSGATSAFNNMNTTGAGNTVRVRLNDAVYLPATTSTTAGIYGIGGNRFVHSFGAPSNTFVGLDAGNLTMTTASANTGVGQESLLELTTGTDNTAIGFRTLQDLTTGSSNTACGYEALRTITTGDINIAIGAQAASTYTSSESNNIIIGNIGVVAESNVIRIGTDGVGAGEQDACYIAGIYNRDIGTTNAPVYIDSTGKLGTKESVSPLGNSSFFAQVMAGGAGAFEPMPQVAGTQTYFLGTSQAENLMWDDFGTFTNGPLAGGCFFTVPTDGIYQINFSMGIFGSNTSIFGGIIFVNGVSRQLVTQCPTPGPGTPGFTNNASSTALTALLMLNAGDIVKWQVTYNCSALNPIGLQRGQTWVYGILLRPLT